ncbi:hypothetical protein [Cyanobium sp. ATX 6F1]|nr:hypothetical protein [Cyanobium sp. ATX 6F1]MCP9917535.1 hypothetical protein [Cyanobium sp. ATX 6F1]
MAPGDHQAVPFAHRIGIGDAERQFVLQQHPAAVLLPDLVVDEESAKVGAIRVPFAGIALSISGDDVNHLQGALVRDWLSNSPCRSIRNGHGAGEHADLDGATDRQAVAEAEGF